MIADIFYFGVLLTVVQHRDILVPSPTADFPEGNIERTALGQQAATENDKSPVERLYCFRVQEAHNAVIPGQTRSEEEDTDPRYKRGDVSHIVVPIRMIRVRLLKRFTYSKR